MKGLADVILPEPVSLDNTERRFCGGVGVMGDARTCDYVCALRAVTSTNGITAD